MSFLKSLFALSCCIFIFDLKSNPESDTLISNLQTAKCEHCKDDEVPMEQIFANVAGFIVGFTNIMHNSADKENTQKNVHGMMQCLTNIVVLSSKNGHLLNIDEIYDQLKLSLDTQSDFVIRGTTNEN